ncbi:hypothetical protein AVEN_45279-1 [Araneus ventricosus]|uniref:Uncharacterized protein n=1 Tax=Araneus ventricosus TaxID=182803 RepID=A0A4Y2XAQ4_ARAVE|nr:hypothetical protein AVEN_45279-1 [Araneus ventricosus]
MINIDIGGCFHRQKGFTTQQKQQGLATIENTAYPTIKYRIEEGHDLCVKPPGRFYSRFLLMRTELRNIMLSFYADGTAILSQGKTPDNAIVPLQNYLKNLKALLVRWKLRLNVDKTEAVLFNKKNDDWPKVKVYGTPIEWKKKRNIWGLF